MEAELRALKSQVNPHFFFNTLNSLYALTLERSEKAPEMILRLSELMRYVIYESRDELVPIGKQLEFLKSYVFLEQLRSDESLEVRFDITGNHFEISIAPLIYLAFVENAFKHGISNREKSFIDISMNSDDGSISFWCANSIPKSKAGETGENVHSGIGLENVTKRLNLLFPDRHEIKINKTSDEFEVLLQIKTA